MYDLPTATRQARDIVISQGDELQQSVNNTEKQNFVEFTEQEPDSPFLHSYKVGFLTSLKDNSDPGIYFVSHDIMPGVVRPYTFFSSNQILQGEESLVAEVLDAVSVLSHN